ncbi:MMPL family transporter [Nocardia cyriacigeorgica]|uniref:MMPL family transporter n=1 Tax=Nocardia cyriacigeorgica TaxID=135487 RepID=UPI0018951DC7|nr:MMPL family transporter [Nocardia cyriacigeorgica]MBF6160495.1 MMPL family transporter [Nocardia cyriacigeorgica]MBF6199738.1 MMPL family transporter [Nocardia cyriacigeorgica]MBF6319963.1 MMPL family transporter [Nocardia cyriacigeorgica]MBF6517179.1 MMPL family transporter [Nocardia cyriacigeorgica]MBF6534381.1 MMPL family transporter [Nocardia cyriacigeorgica]
MFAELTQWADVVVRRRFTVLGVMVAGLLALGWYGLGLGGQLSSSGWDDPGSESVRAAQLRDEVFGIDHSADVLLLFHAPEGTAIDDPAFADPIVAWLNELPQRFPDQIDRVNGAYWPTETGVAMPDIFGTDDRRHAFASVAISGTDDTVQMRNYRAVAPALTLPGVDMEVAGGQAVAGALNDTMAHDQRRMELFAIPAVAVLLFFLFGGVLAAALPLIVGGLTVLGAWGLLRLLTTVTEVNSFVSPVVSMVGLGLAIDYGLFVLSRFREELADGRDVDDAVRRAVQTAGRTVLFSATIVVVAAGAILVFPQGFLKSFAYGAIITISLAAVTSITVLPAMLAVLGRRVDRLGVAWFRTATAPNQEPDNMWGRIAGRVMKRPLAVGIVVCLGLLLLILPMRNLAFGSINERFLPPEHPTRLAQQHFDELFPLRQIDPIDLVIVTFDTGAGETVVARANQAPGLAAPFPALMQRPAQRNVFATQTVLGASGDAGETIDYLRSMPLPSGTTLLVGGQPAIEKDSIDALVERMPYMIALVFLATTVLMALTFGSLVLPVKAAALNLLGLGATLGVLTWVFIDGHGADLLGFTPQPIMALVLVVIVSVIYGLSTDYEIFLLSRIVEARAAGLSTTDAIRAGVAHTGRIITAAALILLVVTGAFALSDLVMMQYIAFGMVTALLVDATVLRVLLVPASMRLLGEACWWAPRWMRRVPRAVTVEQAPPAASSGDADPAPVAGELR